jgi:glucose repression regulatory protein TUP1
MAQPQIPLAQSNVLADLDIEQLPENLKKEGSDWFAVFNPRARRVLDVDLIHNLPHQSVVCCVRFSLDGRFVATGCNRSAQIFDVETGHPMAHLQDSSLPEDGDLYIRSVCFSPSGQYLATGAEDKVIRVSKPFFQCIIDTADIIPGLGHPHAPDQAPVHRPRAGHLLSRFCPQR